MIGADGSISAPVEVPCLDKCELEVISFDAAVRSTDPDAESCDSSAEWDSERDSTFGSYSSGLSLGSQECWVDKQVETVAAPFGPILDPLFTYFGRPGCPKWRLEVQNGSPSAPF